MNNFELLFRMVQLLRRESAWVQEQTFHSLRKHTIEEVFELVDAIDHDDADAVRDEIGDLFFHCVFYSVVAESNSRWNAADALESVIQKLIRRHPHVDFEAMSVRKGVTSQHESELWELAKRTEKRESHASQTPTHRSVLAGLSRATPALPRAVAMSHKLEAAGFKLVDDVVADGMPTPVATALGALLDALSGVDASVSGKVMFGIANAMSRRGIDVDSALARANADVERRVVAIELAAGATPLTQLSTDQQRSLMQ
jgi:nucleoside triphosphate diphosphatase